jgi:acetyl-CoA carboxylase carboxyltransferase component
MEQRDAKGRAFTQAEQIERHQQYDEWKSQRAPAIVITVRRLNGRPVPTNVEDLL